MKPLEHGERRGTLYAYAYVIIVNYIIALWFLTRYLFERVVMPKLLGPSFRRMDEGNQRTMVNHFVNIFWKTSTLFGLYPFIMTVVLGHSERTYLQYGKVTYGDLLALDYMLFTAGFLFEIIYRSRISLVTAIHHIVALFLSTLVAVIIVNNPRNLEAQAELKLIFTYGFFEVFFETGPHVMMILYRRNRHDTKMLARGFRIIAVMSFTGTFLEQFAIMYLFAKHWPIWDYAFKVLTPILHLCFAAAQLHGGRIFLSLSRKMAKEEREKQQHSSDPESVTGLSLCSSAIKGKSPVLEAMTATGSEAGTTIVTAASGHSVGSSSKSGAVLEYAERTRTVESDAVSIDEQERRAKMNFREKVKDYFAQ
ncbi:hypothetical protein PYCC9005_004709 [Savitreella phatthalungensis]